MSKNTLVITSYPDNLRDTLDETDNLRIISPYASVCGYAIDRVVIDRVHIDSLHELEKFIEELTTSISVRFR